MAAVPRSLHPALNAPGYMAAAGALYAAAVMAYNVANHHGVIDVPVVVAAVAAVAALLTRTAVTPVADPRDGAGNPLVPAARAAAASPPLPGTGAVRVIAEDSSSVTGGSPPSAPP